MGVISNVQVFKATGSGAMDETLTVNQNFTVETVFLHLSSAGATAENFVIQQDDTTSAAYDTIIFSQDMNGNADIVFLPNQTIPFQNGDELDFTYTNTDARTWGLEVRYRLEV